MAKNYKDSSNRALYEKIAEDTDSTPEHVFELAHGSHVKNHEDNVILSELEKCKIVNVRKTKHKRRSSNPHDKKKNNMKAIIGLIIAMITAMAIFFYIMGLDREIIESFHNSATIK